MTPKRRGHRVLDDTFKASIVVKGVDGLLEVVGGLVLLLVPTDRLNRLAHWLTQHELSQDRHDFVATHLLHLTESLRGTPVFAGLYLLTHGVVKVVLVAALLRNKMWAYPATLVFLVGFIVYQLYRMFIGPSVGLALLTVFDAFVTWLVWREYRLRRLSPARVT